MSTVLRTCVFLAATATLCAAPPDDAVARLVRQLGDDDFATRERAEQELWRLGERSAAAVTAAAGDADPEVARRARRLRDHFRWGVTPDTPAAVLELVRELHDGSPQLERRRELVAALFAAGPAAHPALLASLDAADEKARDDAYDSLITAGWVPLAREIAAGRDDLTAAVLERAVSKRVRAAAPDYAVFLFRAGRTAEAVARLSKPTLVTEKERYHARVLMFLHRMAGDLPPDGGPAAALVAARESGNYDWVRAILVERGAWGELLDRRSPWEGMVREGSAWHADLGQRAAYQRLAGRPDAAAFSLSHFRGQNTQAAVTLLVNREPADAVAELLGKGNEHGWQADLLAHRLRLREALAAADGTGGAIRTRALRRVRVRLELGLRHDARELVPQLLRAAEADPEEGGSGEVAGVLGRLGVAAWPWQVPPRWDITKAPEAVCAAVRDAGRVDLARALLASPDWLALPPPAVVQLADLLAERDDWAGAAAAYRRAWDAGHDNPTALWLHGHALTRLGQQSEGEAWMGRARLMCSVGSHRRWELHNNLSARGHTDAARGERVIGLALGHEDSWDSGQSIDELADEREKAGDFFAAADARERLLLRHLTGQTTYVQAHAYPDATARVHSLRAAGHAKDGRKAEALREAEAAEAQSPAGVGPTVRVVAAFERAGWKPEADALLERVAGRFEAALREFPDAADVRRRLALLLSRGGRRPDDALAHARRAVAGLPSGGRWPEGSLYLETLAEVHSRRGERGPAVEQARRALLFAERHSKSYYRQRVQRFEAGDPAPPVLE